MTNLQAAFGCAQFENIDNIIFERSRVYVAYQRELEGIHGLKPQRFAPEVDPVLWTMVVSIDNGEDEVKKIEERRDAVMALMSKDGIETRPGFTL